MRAVLLGGGVEDRRDVAGRGSLKGRKMDERRDQRVAGSLVGAGEWREVASGGVSQRGDGGEEGCSAWRGSLEGGME